MIFPQEGVFKVYNNDVGQQKIHLIYDHLFSKTLLFESGGGGVGVGVNSFRIRPNPTYNIFLQLVLLESLKDISTVFRNQP